MFVDFKPIEEMTERERFDELEIILQGAMEKTSDKIMLVILDRAMNLTDSIGTTIYDVLLDKP